ncbi:MAG: BamA/TamA family outer membrane protein [Prolixibacteraceae bacterium]
MRVFLFSIGLVTLLFTGCISTRYVPDDNYLLSDIEIQLDNDQIDREELTTHLRQKENLRILGIFKMHLWLYNLSRLDKEKGWLKNIGESPVIYDSGLENKSVQQLQQYLYNKGYYQATVHDTVYFKKKKAKEVFRIKTGEPYLIQTISYQIKDPNIAKIFLDRSDESLLKTGEIFDVDLLEKERLRIANQLKNLGYYKFVEEFVHFQIDTSYYDRRANIELILESPKSLSGSGMEQSYHKKWSIADYSIYIDKQKKGNSDVNGAIYNDTTITDGYSFYHNGEMALHKNLFYRAIEIEPGSTYSKKGEDKTYNNLYALRQFKFVNIQYHEQEDQGDSLNGVLEGRIFLPLQVKQNYSIDVEGTNTSGNLGIGGNINYQHRNLLGGAEIFDITFKGANERQVTIINEQNAEFKTLELGGQMKLTVPGFLLPVNEEKFNLFSLPFTTFSLAYNYQERPDYTRDIMNATVGYIWKSSAKFSHVLNVLDLNAVRIFSLNPDFIDQIQDLYIKSSYTNHIISSTNYSLVFNDQGLVKRPDYHYFRLNLESAGNLLRTFAAATGNEKFTNDISGSGDQSFYYKYFGTRFAQYVKADFDFRYGYRFDKFNSIATRAFAGLALPYGNFNVIPFEKRYFTGGANGIRGWQVRSLGPGSYAAGSGEYPNQSADIKLEANVEYRFRLFWIFEGAFFLDGGNIWAINQYDNREGAMFELNRFYKEFAIGTGFGLRLVSPYFILRTDLGLKLRDPSLPMGSRWIPLIRGFNSTDLNFNIAIGYPF